MNFKLPTRYYRLLLIVASSVSASVAAAHLFGVFNLLEWGIRDLFFALRPEEAAETEVVIVTIDEEDIKRSGDWPIPDRTLAQAIERIRAQEPSAIGLAIYRNLPEEPGYEELLEVFRTTPNLYGVERIAGDRVEPPQILQESGRVGLADLPLDGDRKVRRALLSATDEEAGDAVKPGLAAQLALKYLEERDITLESLNAEKQIFRLGQATFEPLRNREAGYAPRDLGGYQILLNWRGPTASFPTVTLRAVLAGQIPADLMRDRIVLIGSNASSNSDFFATPYSFRWFASAVQIPGVVIHANITSQILHSALDGRPLLRGWSAPVQIVWIVTWAVFGSFGIWFAIDVGSTPSRRLPGGIALWVTLVLAGGLASGSYLTFLGGIIVPVMSPLTAFLLSTVATTNAHKQQKLASANQQLAVANDQLATANEQLLDYSKNLEYKVEARTHELKLAKQAADAASQAKSDFLASMSHELRTPLNGILGYAQLMQRANDLNQHRRGVSVVHQCGTHLLNLINDILDLSKIEARKMELYPTNVHLASFLDGIVAMTRIRAEQKDVELSTEFSLPDSSGISIDEKRLRQVLLNLLGNAVKFTAVGSVKFVVRVLKVSHNTLPSVAQLYFAVEDTGPGVPADQLEAIFLPFEQTGSGLQKSQGTGLGLAISQQIIQLMGGKIRARSVLGQGSTFYFELTIPLTDHPHRQVAGDRGQILGYDGQPRKLLIVDDNELNRAIILETLQPLGFVCADASEGSAGLAIASEFEPDLILTDLVMSGLDGFEFIQRLRHSEKFADVPIVASSASILNEDRARCFAAGCNDFIAKPIDVDQLLRCLEKQLNLEWVYATPAPAKSESLYSVMGEPVPASAIIFPPAAETTALHNLARIGDIDGIQREVERIQQLDRRYLAFVTRVLQLVEEFDDQAIVSLLERSPSEHSAR